VALGGHGKGIARAINRTIDEAGYALRRQRFVQLMCVFGGVGATVGDKDVVAPKGVNPVEEPLVLISQATNDVGNYHRHRLPK
jgi:hypothetical protein